VTWYAIEVQSAEARRDAVAAWLVERTGQAVEERADGTLVSFALTLPEADAITAELHQAHGPGLTVGRQSQAAVDWSLAWREGLGVRRVGRFAITPSWLQPDPIDDGLVIVIDPEMAFGSGEHGSTRAALALLQGGVARGDTVLDLGSGSGILSIAAIRLGATRAIGIEVEPDAIVVATRNAAQNGVAASTTFLEGDAAQIAPLLAPVDLIVSNILRLVNVALLPEVRSTLRTGGTAIFSGMEQGEAALFLPELTRAGFTPTAQVVEEGWWAVAATRP
jgi:ribosomal protein L11 methyltransferase